PPPATTGGGGGTREGECELRRRPIAGDVYTQATGIEHEQNGLINPETGALRVPSGLLRSSSPHPNG
ncbi:MAG TPA: hypothetical protein VIN00_03945, partial [Candidatus Dormibacteraeota bacterium]